MRRRRIASHGNSTLQARAARRNFCSRKELLLAAHASEHRGADTVLVALERYHDKLAREFLRLHGGTAAAWQEHGPALDLEEVRAAFKDPAAWQRLVEAHASRRRAAGSFT